jgi:cell shape-determining protein MreD
MTTTLTVYACAAVFTAGYFIRALSGGEEEDRATILSTTVAALFWPVLWLLVAGSSLAEDKE